MSEEDKKFCPKPEAAQTREEVLVCLTEKIVQNNNSVSTAVVLVAENVEALTVANERTEKKVNDLLDDNEEFLVFIKAVKESGLLEIASLLKKTIYTFIIGMGLAFAYGVGKGAIIPLIKHLVK